MSTCPPAEQRELVARICDQIDERRGAALVSRRRAERFGRFASAEFWSGFDAALCEVRAWVWLVVDADARRRARSHQS